MNFIEVSALQIQNFEAILKVLDSMYGEKQTNLLITPFKCLFTNAFFG